MAIVQKSSATVNGASTINPSLSGVAAGNTLALVISSTLTTDNTPTDSAGQTWSKAFYLVNSAAATVAVYYLLSANSGAHTLTWTAGGPSFVGYSFIELPACTAVDVIGTLGTAVNSATTLSSPSITTTNAADAIIAVFCADTASGSTNAAITDPPTGYTSVYAQQNTSVNVGAQHSYKEVSSTGAQSATWTFNADTSGSTYAAAAVAFKQSATGASFACAGQAKATGAGALTPRPQFAGAGFASAAASALLTVRSPLVSAGAAGASGSAALTVRGALAGAGVGLASGSAGLTVQVAFSGAGIAAGNGVAALSTGASGANLAAMGVSSAAGAASLTTRDALASSGRADASGAGALTVTTQFAGTGAAVAAGSAALATSSSGAAFAGAGSIAAQGSSSLTTRAALAGSGFSIATGAGVLMIGAGGISFVATGRAAATGSATLTPRAKFAGAGAAPVTGLGALALASQFVPGNIAVWLVPERIVATRVSQRSTVATIPARQLVAQAID